MMTNPVRPTGGSVGRTGFRLRAVGATDATSPNADAVTASWDLTPCPDPVAGPVTAGCAG